MSTEQHALPERPPADAAWTVARRLVAHAIRSAPRRVAALLGLGAMHSVFEGASVMLLLPVLASLGVGQAGSSVISDVVAQTLGLVGLPYTLGTTLSLVVLVGLVTALTDLMHTRVADSTERRFASNLQLEVYVALAGSRAIGLSRQRVGHTTAVLTKFSEQAAIAFVRMTRVVTGSMSGLVLVGVALTQAWPFVVATGGVIAVLAWPLWRASRATYQLVLETQRQVRKLWVVLADELRLLPTIKAFGNEKLSIDKVTFEVTRTERMFVAIKHRIAAVRVLLQPFFLTLLCLAVYLGVSVFAVPVDRLFLLVGVFVRLMPTVVRIMAEGQDLPILLVTHDEVERFISTCRSTKERRGGELAPRRLDRGLALTDVTVTDGSTVILNRLSLSVPAGAFVGIVGESGAGKTTIVSTILGLATPSEGTVTIDGQDLARIDLRSWRRRVGYVSQDTVVFGQTIRANLAFAARGADDAAMFAALDAAEVGDFVRSLPEGLDSYIGEGGSLISGGERQRIAIARALLRDPLLLILDEATSALDAETTERLITMLERVRGRRTLIVIAHDLDVVRTADTICLVERGLVAEQGTWSELVDRRGQLFRMAVLQGRA